MDTEPTPRRVTLRDLLSPEGLRIAAWLTSRIIGATVGLAFLAMLVRLMASTL